VHGELLALQQCEDAYTGGIPEGSKDLLEKVGAHPVHPLDQEVDFIEKSISS
jgi:hypothetical protein